MKRLHEEYPCFVPTATHISSLRLLPMFRPYGSTHVSSLRDSESSGGFPLLPIFRPYGTRFVFKSVGNKKRKDNQIAPKIIIVH